MSQVINEENIFETLKIGSEGAMVHVVQKSLIQIGFDITENSVFDEQMERIVKEFQSQRGLKSDGLITMETMIELDKAYLEHQKK